MPVTKSPTEVAVSSEDEDSDDDVQILPYTKPPPPLIDLLESCDEDDTSGEEPGPSTSKNKKTRHNRNNLTSVPSADLSPSTVNAGQNELSLNVVPTRAVNDAINDRESAETSLNAERIGANHNQSWRDVGVRHFLSVIRDSIQVKKFEKAHLPWARRKASSSSAPINDALGEGLPSSANNCAEVGHGSNSVKGQSQATHKAPPANKGTRTAINNCPPLHAADIIHIDAHSSQNKVSQKRDTSNLTKKRTQAEINNFLTTLGVLEPNEPICRGKKRPRQQSVPPLSTALLPSPSVPVSEFDYNPVSSTSTSSARLEKLVRRTKVSASEVQMTSQSKPLVTEAHSTAPTTTAKGGVVPAGILFGQPRFVSTNEDVEMLTRSERATLSFNISSVFGPVTPTTTSKTSQSGLQKPSTKPQAQVNSTKPEDPKLSIENNDDGSVATRPSYIPSKWTAGMVKFYDCTSQDNYRLSRELAKMSGSPALWKTNEQQLQLSSQKVNRIRCFNCKERGHVRFNCKEKRRDLCHICGEKGHFVSELEFGTSRCPNEVCLHCGCGQPGNKITTRGCQKCITKKPQRCEICHAEGHAESHCPDNWRRFFSTTMIHQGEDGLQFYGDKPVYRTQKNSYCANCGQIGHNFFNCLSEANGDKYIRQNPRILIELPKPRNKLLPAASPKMTNNHNPTSTDKDNADEIEILTNGKLNKCMDPECENTLKPNSFCFEMVIKRTEHKLMLKAQEENKIVGSMKPDNQLSIFQNRNAIHIYSETETIAETQADVLQLISRLKLDANKKSNNNGSNDRSKDANIPELVTLDDDNDIEVKKRAESLTVALLQSEWDLMLSESRKRDGLIAQLTEKFNVSLHISKDNMMVTIEDGTEEDRIFAHKNIVFWLESQTPRQRPPIARKNVSPSNSKKSKKRPRHHSPSPPESRKSKKQKLENPNLIPLGVRNQNSRNSPQNQNDFFQKDLANPNLVPLGIRNQNSSQNQTNFFPNPCHFQQSQNNFRPQDARHNISDRTQQDILSFGQQENSNNMRHENQQSYQRHFNGQQIAFQNYGGGFFNDYSIPLSEFHPSFNHQPHRLPMWPEGNDNSFKFNFDFRNPPKPNTRSDIGDKGNSNAGNGVGNERGRGDDNNCRDNNNIRSNPGQKVEDKKKGRNLLRYYNSGAK